MAAPHTTHHLRRASGFAGALSFALLLCLTLAACGAAASPPRHAPSVAKASSPGRTLVVMGASDAYGVGTNDPDRLNWPTQLAAELPQPTHLVNLGIPGATLAQAQQEELPIAAAQHAQIVVIWLAVNDIIDGTPLPTYTTELRDTLATLRRASPSTRIFVGNVPDLAELPYFAAHDPATLRAEVNAWNAAIAQVCVAEGATVADLANAWGEFDQHPEYISYDGLHPSLAGARALANFFDIVIRRAMRISG